MFDTRSAKLRARTWRSVKGATKGAARMGNKLAGGRRRSRSSDEFEPANDDDLTMIQPGTYVHGTP